MAIIGNRIGILWGGLSGFFWALDAVFIALVLQFSGWDTVTALAVSLVVVACHDMGSVLWLLLRNLYTGAWRAVWQELRYGEGWLVALAALCGGPLGMSFYVLAIAEIGAAPTAVISAVYPALGVCLAALFGLDKFRLHMVGGVVVAVGSMAVLSYTPEAVQGVSIHGLLLGLLCAIGWGAECVICSYGFTKDIDSDVALSIRQLVSGLVYFIVVLPYFDGWVWLPKLVVNPVLVLGIMVTALVGTLSYLFYYRAIATLGPIRAMGLNITYTAWAVVISALVWGTAVSLRDGAAALGVMAGSMWTVASIRVWLGKKGAL